LVVGSLLPFGWLECENMPVVRGTACIACHSDASQNSSSERLSRSDDLSIAQFSKKRPALRILSAQDEGARARAYWQSRLQLR
jgi:hypothetical protein